MGRIGRKESEDEFISGMTLTEDLKLVNQQLKNAGEKSDLQVCAYWSRILCQNHVI
ncbi:hypothetical protein NB714_004635 [Pantoea dispersa]|nr:hypothetical protein [Pantoea dispersa]MCW0328510.1 hypothetical protein [Pantoea dispersa]MCW0434935.1 hypothetical protein [Pantoea dispersa]